MSVDAKLFVVCNQEDVIAIGNAVTTALNEYVRFELDEYWKNNTDAHNRFHFLRSEDYKRQSSKFTNGVRMSASSFDMFIFEFGIGDAFIRNLYMFPTCSSDHDDIDEGYKIIFSIGHYGRHSAIMQVVADAVMSFGDVYYDHNDCDDEDFIKLN